MQIYIAEGIKINSPQIPDFIHNIRHTKTEIQVDQM